MSVRWEKRLDKVIEVSEKVVEAEKAVAKLKKGGNSPAKAVLIRLAEQALTAAIKAGMKRLRQRRQPRDKTTGRYR